MARQTNGKMRIIYRDIYAVEYLEKNFKRHALDEAEASIRMRGFIDPVGFNPNTYHIFDGNGRVEALRIIHKHWKDGDLDENNQPYEVPTGIEVIEQGWHAPFIDIPMSADEEIAAAAAINQINKLGGYDEAFQLEILQELQEKDLMHATGFTDQDLQELLKRFPPPRQRFDEKNPDAELINIVGDGESKSPTSQVKQVYMFYSPEKYDLFVKLTAELAEHLNTDNASDCVLEALKYVDKDVKSNAAVV
jgi:hypothetical protein